MSKRNATAVPLGVALATVLALSVCPSVSWAQEACLECHNAADPAADLGIDVAAWSASIHAEIGLECSDCHTGEDPHDTSVPAASCADCHDDAAVEFARSVHGESHQRNGEAEAWPEGEACSVCHGVHDARAVADPESRVHITRIAQTCGQCHGDLAIVQAFGLSTAPFDNYQNSVHGLANGDPDRQPAACTDCHSAHLVLRASDPESLINPFRIATTCGTCHAEESEQYLGSVHGVAFARGVSASPTCTDCHGIHSIRVVPEEGATPLEERLVRSTCVTCHSSEALMGEYGIASARVRSYQATYHGLALKRGTTAVADCASCHGIHAIYPSSDPNSSVAPANLEATCGHCHPGAGEQFANSPVHFAVGEPDVGTVITNWVRWSYWALIAVVIGGMLLHNGIIVGYHIRRKVQREKAQACRPRFSRGQVLQHGILLVSFTVLAISGFALAYPDFWWSRLLEGLGLTEPIRRWLHRAAAVGLLAAAAYHVAWIVGTAYGRAELRRILPGWHDLRAVVRNLRFHLGRADRPPEFAKYDYPAKVEYWAVVWGTAIMGLTGIVLWFPVWATSFLPSWSITVSQVIHLLEAWLATLAILLFHFFYVFGHPEVYPVNLAMFSGKMTEKEARHRHGQWLAEEPTAPRRPTDKGDL